MFYVFNRVNKREFDRAFAAGLPVAMVKDAAYARTVGDSFVTRGFTNATVSDPYADGPSRAGERWFYWAADVATATPVGPVDYNSYRSESEPWGFHCDVCGERTTTGESMVAGELREAHVAVHTVAVQRQAEGVVKPLPDRESPEVQRIVATVLDDYADNLTPAESVEFYANTPSWVDLLAESVIAGMHAERDAAGAR